MPWLFGIIANRKRGPAGKLRLLELDAATYGRGSIFGKVDWGFSGSTPVSMEEEI
jgi:hypothetical protein